MRQSRHRKPVPSGGQPRHAKPSKSNHQVAIREFLRPNNLNRIVGTGKERFIRLRQVRRQSGDPQARLEKAPGRHRRGLQVIEPLAQESIYSLAWSYPINVEIGYNVSLLYNLFTSNILRHFRSRGNLVDQLYRRRLKFYGRNIAGVDENTQSLKQLLNLGLHVGSRFHLTDIKREQFAISQRIHELQEALVTGIKYEKQGFSKEDLTQWAIAVATKRALPEEPPSPSAGYESLLAEPVLHQVKTQDGWGYAIVDGRLWMWNPQDQVEAMLSKEPNPKAGWYRTQIEASRIKLGANGVGYLLTGSGLVIELPTKDGTNERVERIARRIQEGGLIRIRVQNGETLGDFAISPAGSIVYTLTKGQPGELFYINRSPSARSLLGKLRPRSISIPSSVKPFNSHIRAMAFDGFDLRESLYLQDQEGNYCRGHMEDDNDGWVFEEVDRTVVPEHLKPWFVAGAVQSLDPKLANEFFGQFAGPTGLYDLSMFGFGRPNKRRLKGAQNTEERWRDKFLSFLHNSKQHWQIFFHEFTPMVFRPNARERQREAETRLAKLAESIAAQPERLRKHNFAKPSEFRPIAEAIDQFNYEVVNSKSQLTRALQARDPKIKVVDHYSGIIAQLTEGDSIDESLDRGQGVDGDGAPPVGSFFKGILALFSAKHLPPELLFLHLNTFNIRLTPARMRRRAAVFKITKTTEGINFSVTVSTEKERTPWSANFSVGGGPAPSAWWGLHLLPRSIRSRLPWFFTGGEYHPSGGKSTRSETTATWSIPHNDRGAVNRFVETFFSGKLQPEKLLDLNDPATVSVTVGKTKSKLWTHPVQVLPAVFGWTQNLARYLQREDLFGFVKQRAYGWTHTTGRAIIRGPDTTVERVIDTVVRSVENRNIYVWENQDPDPLVTIVDIPLRDNVKETPMTRVRPVKDRKRKSRWEKRSVSHGYDVVRGRADRNRLASNSGGPLPEPLKKPPSALGGIIAVRVEVQTDNPRAHDLARTDRIHPEAEHFTPEFVPQLNEFLEKHPEYKPFIQRIRQSGEPVHITLELKSKWLPLVQDFDSLRIKQWREPDGITLQRKSEWLNLLQDSDSRQELYSNPDNISFTKKGFHDLITKLRDRSDCWRIIKIEATATRTHTEESSPGFMIWRARRSASISRNWCNARIEVQDTPNGEEVKVAGAMLQPGVHAHFGSIHKPRRPGRYTGARQSRHLDRPPTVTTKIRRSGRHIHR